MDYDHDEDGAKWLQIVHISEDGRFNFLDYFVENVTEFADEPETTPETPESHFCRRSVSEERAKPTRELRRGVRDDRNEPVAHCSHTIEPVAHCSHITEPVAHCSRRTVPKKLKVQKPVHKKVEKKKPVVPKPKPFRSHSV